MSVVLEKIERRKEKREAREGRTPSVGFAFEEGFILRGGHEAVQLVRLRHLHNDDPAVAVGVAVDELRMIREPRVDGNDCAAHWREEGRDRFGRLNLRHLRAVRNGRADHGKREVDDIAEGILREIGDADRGAVTLDSNPFVLFVIAKVRRNHAGFRPGKKKGISNAAVASASEP